MKLALEKNVGGGATNSPTLLEQENEYISLVFE